MSLVSRAKATLRRGALVAPVLLATATFSPAAFARPGTPTDVVAFVEDHRRITFAFRNTATEPVVFDFDILVNGIASPQNRTHFNCGAPEETNLACQRVMSPQQPFTFKGQQLAINSNQMGPGSKVCVRVIAREWNNGNPQWGQVSDQWSAWTCATMKPLPAAPPVPAPPQLQYFAPVPARGLPGQVRLGGSYPTPRFKNANGRFDLWSTTEKLVNGAWQPVDLKPVSGPAASWPLSDDGVAPPSPTNPLVYRVCVANDGGSRCSASAQVYSDVISRVPPPPAPQPAGAGPSTPCTTCNAPGTKPRPIQFQ